VGSANRRQRDLTSEDQRTPEVAVPDAPVVPASVTGGAYGTAALIVAALLADGAHETDAGSPIGGGAVDRRARHAKPRFRATAGERFA
jgi:hypothetical protein